ncbi:MAG TPA: hypothetical protein VGH33_06430 [Isosphaeraceae bacterium]|jgi:hypothetical protein
MMFRLPGVASDGLAFASAMLLSLVASAGIGRVAVPSCRPAPPPRVESRAAGRGRELLDHLRAEMALCRARAVPEFREFDPADP